jgi:hypothetical protein
MIKIFLSALMILVLEVSLMAETVPTENNVAKLYVATFNRAPDSAGLDYWVNDSKLSLEGIASSFFEQPETKATYPESSSVTDFVTAVYSNLFNRKPDLGGLNYWVDELNSGKIAKSVFILAVINGAKDTSDGNDAMTLVNKTSAGLKFASLGFEDKDKAYAKAALSGVDDDFDSVKKALQNIGIGSTNHTDIIGTWSLGDGSTKNTQSITFYSTGIYIMACDGVSDNSGHAGMEKGTYYWNPDDGTFITNTLVDTNGAWGFEISSKDNVKISIENDTLSLIVPNKGTTQFTKVQDVTNKIVGVWTSGDGSTRRTINITMYDNGYYIVAHDGITLDNKYAGIERGSYTWNEENEEFFATTITDTNDKWGLSFISSDDGVIRVTIKNDILTLISPKGKEYVFTRIDI